MFGRSPRFNNDNDTTTQSSSTPTSTPTPTPQSQEEENEERKEENENENEINNNNSNIIPSQPNVFKDILPRSSIIISFLKSFYISSISIFFNSIFLCFSLSMENI